MDSNDATSTTARAQELRASLGARRDIEALLAEASAARQAAAAQADALVEEAQQVSEQLLAESNDEAERTTTQARERAESILTRARTDAEDITRQARAAADAVRTRAEAEVEEHRRRVRAEVTEQVTLELQERSRNELARVREQSNSMIGDLEASVRILGVSMEAAVANIGEMLGSLEELRAHTVESLGEADPVSPSLAHDDADDPADVDSDDLPGDETDEIDEDDTADPATTSVFVVQEVDGLEVIELPEGIDETDTEGDQVPPQTATEAFLRSANVDYGDPPLPPMDDAEVGARYARDARAARPRPRQRDRAGERRPDEETLEVLPAKERVSVRDDRENGDDDDRDSAGRPLGWLFRSSP